MTKKILVVGDVMVDRYVYVTSNRKAPEAPIPVWDAKKIEQRLGGAANVAHNLKALGGDDVKIYLAGIVGKYRKEIEKVGIDVECCADGPGNRLTMIKERYVDENGKYVFRCDNFKKFPESGPEELAEQIRFCDCQVDAVVFSDYDKGTITSEVVDVVKEVTNANLFVVDSKRVDLSIFEGMDVLKLNEDEYATQVSKGPYTNVESLFKAVVVTKGSKGAQLRIPQKMIVDRRVDNEPKVIKSSNYRYIVESEDFPVIAANVKDVTGCGDTHTAAMTYSLLTNGDIRMAVKFGNECARSVVQKFGTSVVK